MPNNIAVAAQAMNDEYRSAAMNWKYYGARLERVKQINLTLELVLAISSSGAIAAWNIWQSGAGETLWKVLAAVAAVIAVVKPLIGLDKSIERYSELVVGYAALFYDMRKLIADGKAANTVTAEDWARFGSVQQRIAALGVRDDPVPKRRLHMISYETVLREMPDDLLWWPKETEDARLQDASA